MTARAKETAGTAGGFLVLALWIAVSGGCLSPGQSRSMALQVEEIRRQVDQISLQQERTRNAFRALEPAPAATAILPPPAASTPPAPAGEQQYRSGYALYHQGDYAGAEKALRAFLKDGSGSRQADAARYWIGESLRARGLHREAISEYRGVADHDRSGLWAARALYKMALSQETLGQSSLAQESLRALLQSFPDSDVAPLARDRLKATEKAPGRPAVPRRP